jgi:hypothetical protein
VGPLLHPLLFVSAVSMSYTVLIQLPPLSKSPGAPTKVTCTLSSDIRVLECSGPSKSLKALPGFS